MLSRAPTVHVVLGLSVVGLALLLLLVWIPMDTDSAILQQVRRRTRIGDAAAPSLAAMLLLIGGLMLSIVERTSPAQPRPTRRQIGFLLAVLAVLVVGLLAMRWTGPIAAWALNAGEYRLLRNTVPWKYSGFLLGGTIMVAGLIALMEERFTFRAVLIGILSAAALAAAYDFPFNNLLLPPNGDV